MPNQTRQKACDMMVESIQTDPMLIIALLLQLTGLTFSVIVDAYLRKGQKKVMLIIALLSFILIAQNAADYLMEVNAVLPYVRTITAIIGYSIRPMIIVMFFYVIDSNVNKRWAWYLIILNTLIHLTALFSNICFQIGEDNGFYRGPLGFSCHVISGILLLHLFILSVNQYQHERKLEEWIPFLNLLLVTGAVIMDSFIDSRQRMTTYLTVSIVNCSLFYYIWLHLQFVRAHEQSLKAEQRIQIMMTQIQPHFLYNTISTIKVLCHKDPDKAANIATKFGVYLRQNLDSLGLTGQIPFPTELEHTKMYTDIEMVRFPHIQVEYDINDSDFSLPPLTMQPMVENAIRHGVRIREEGIVRVITKQNTGCHEIVIQDNGLGFDAAQTENDDSSHIGIRNVRERLQTMCGGSLTIDSHIGTGTTVTIRIPIKDESSGAASHTAPERKRVKK